MKVNMMLADSAQVVGGKLYLLGGGWSTIGPEPTPFAVVLLIEVPWNETNHRFQFKLELVTEDDQAVVVPTPQGERPVVLEGAFEVGRPAGMRAGMPLNVPIAINLPHLPLAPDHVYVWRLALDGRTEDDWRLTFTTRPQQHAGAVHGGIAAT